MAGKLGQVMRRAQPDVIKGEPGNTYWDVRRAFDREVKEALEQGLTAKPIVCDTSRALIVDIDAGEFQCNDPGTANRLILSYTDGWVNAAAAGTANSQRLTAPLVMPIGQTFSLININVKGGAGVAFTINLKARSTVGGLTTIATQTSALSATNQTLALTFAPQTIGRSPSGTLFLDVDMPPDAGQSLRLWSAQVHV